MGIAGFALFIAGVIALILYPTLKGKNKRCSAEAEATLREIKINSNDDSGTGYVYIYSYNVNGTEYQLKVYNRIPQTNEIGDTGTIRYNPAKPKEAQAFPASQKLLKIILIAGIVMLLLGIILPFIGFALSI